MIYAAILAGGTGVRMGNMDKPKQYLLLNGKPIIIHTIEKFCVNQFSKNTSGLNDETILVTHDSVRPFVTHRIIEENIDGAIRYGACDTVIAASDTIVESRDGVVISNIPDRMQMYQGQTPQSFKAEKLMNIFESLLPEEKEILTDAAKIFVIKGEPVHLVKGEVFNTKITYSYDLEVAEAMIRREKNAEHSI